MDAISMLRDQLAQSHSIMEQAVADLSPEHLHHRGHGSTVQSIAAIYAHTITNEDYLTNALLREEPFIYQDGWAEKIGWEPGQDGFLKEEISTAMREADFSALREYAQQVYATTDEWLASLSEADLDRQIHVEWAGGDITVGHFLATVIAWHPAHHGGEICALKGNLGGKGLPF